MLPGPVVRPVLVRQTRIYIQEITEIEYGSVLISYATGNIEAGSESLDLGCLGAQNTSCPQTMSETKAY
jgi:hypothetical protein